ncbi:MAG: class I SAM-dependent methyltransferase [Chlamydiales bacterium]|nr:class I SAM-dependent methyltransferase [Chlamydiales bacterium]
MVMSSNTSYKELCTEYYELDKPFPHEKEITYFLAMAKEAQGPLLEPMCGTGRFLIPLLEAGYDITGFDLSRQMLNVCRSKCQDRKLKAELIEGRFEDFNPLKKFDLVFIPSGSFGLLTEQEDVSRALKLIFKWMSHRGKFIFEVETLRAATSNPGVWRGNSIRKNDHSLLVVNRLSSFDQKTGIETTLFRYEQWEKNTIVRTEVEEFSLKLYSMLEIENLLSKHGFLIKSKTTPYSFKSVNDNSESILYECLKDNQAND